MEARTGSVFGKPACPRGSGLDLQQEYYKQQGVKELSFSLWKRRFAKLNQSAVRSFVPVAVKDRNAPTLLRSRTHLLNPSK